VRGGRNVVNKYCGVTERGALAPLSEARFFWLRPRGFPLQTLTEHKSRLLDIRLQRLEY
jgi:hypothetical protein